MPRLLLVVLIGLIGAASSGAGAQQTGGSCAIRFGGTNSSRLGVCAPVERWTEYRYVMESVPPEPPNPPYGYASEQDAINAFTQKWPDTCHWGPPMRMSEDWFITSIAWGIVTAGPLHFDDLNQGAQTIENKKIWYDWYQNDGPCEPHWRIHPSIILTKQRGAGCPTGFWMGNWDPADIDPPFSYPPTWVWSYGLQKPFVCWYEPPADPKDLGCCSSPGLMGGNPIHLGTGNKYQAEIDFSDPGGGLLTLARAYNSQGYDITTLGKAWRHSFERSIYANTWTNGSTLSGTALARRPDGKSYTFQLQTDSTWKSDADVVERLQQHVDGSGATLSWTLVTKSDETESYDASGRLTTIAYLNGQVLTLVYSDASTPPAIAPGPNFLLRVQDALARAITFTYDSNGRLVQFSDTAGAQYLYAYDAANNRLASVTYPDGGVREYLYNEPAYTSTDVPYALTGIIDENGDRFATFTYDDLGRAIASEHAGGAGRVSLSYNGGVTTLVDALGTRHDLTFSRIAGSYRGTAASQPCAACAGVVSRSASYDANGNVSAREDFNGVDTLYGYDLTRNLQTSRTEASGRPQQRITTTQWHPTYRLPAQITEPAPGGTKTTAFSYDGNGNLQQKAITAPKNDGSNGTISRVWNWTYQTLGRVLTAVDPNGKTTTYTYYADSDPDLGKRGRVATVTNPAGHVTQITSYDLTGRPLTIVDPNGLVTTLTYAPRGWLISRLVGVELTAYDYDDAGQLIKITAPDGSYVQNIYDPAHRLTQTNDGLGNRIAYTPDLMGNRLEEQVFDPSNTLTRLRAREFDDLNRLQEDIGALNQTTTYTYDGNNNLLRITDPLGHTTANAYDALNRVTSVLDANLGVAKYAYDAANNLTQVTDQRGLNTSYTYDGLNDLTKQISPDTGTTTMTYDPAGNVLTRTDAAGATATYTYDNLNRATQVIYSRTGTPSETHSFTYDVGTNAKGKLTQVTDPAAMTTWTYNNQARVASKAQQVGTISKTVAYAYNAGAQLTTITTPSGQQIGYTYLNNRVRTITINGQTLLLAGVTMPFGPMAAWSWANTLFEFRDYDTDGRVATWEFRDGVSILRKNQSFDTASRITAISDPNNPTANQTYQYDVLDRLTVAQTGTPTTHTEQFTYDALGNRLSVTLDGSVTNSTYGGASNQLQALTGTIPVGYGLGSGSWSFSYNNAGRLVAVLQGGATIATYQVSALGQRVAKTVSGLTTIFIYDEQGHLLGEYEGNGNLIQETVWLEDLPVATLRPTGAPGNPTPINIYYVHADHLGSPRAVTRPSDNVLMWQWDNVDPFGANAANENPGGQGTFKYNLRFPGQYYDVETGIHYNYYRDYDPAIGRYGQSDPIGLRGGLNTYGYVLGNPLIRVDPRGLEECEPPCTCRGGIWDEVSATNWTLGVFFGGGIIVGRVEYQCRSNRKLQCKMSVFCVGGGLIASAALCVDISPLSTAMGVPSCSGFNAWSSSITAGAGPGSSTGNLDGGGSVSGCAGVGGGGAFISCRAFNVRCEGAQ